MDWDKWMQDMELPLLCMAGFFVLYCLGLLAAESVGLLIGHTLLLFPAFRRYLARKKTEEFFRLWDEHYPKGITANIYYRVGDGEWQLSRTFDLAPESEVNQPEEPVMDQVSELEKLKTDTQGGGLSNGSETCQRDGIPGGDGLDIDHTVTG
jgi:hypothetical protein